MYRVSILFFIFLSGCGAPSVSELGDSIDKTGVYIKQQSWDKASDESRNIEDRLNYHKSEYRKSDVKKLEDMQLKLEKEIEVLNRNKSLEKWKALKKQWGKMNSK